MAGKYLRKIRDDDRMRDPTMTHMRDPHAVKVGDILRDDYGYDVVRAIKERCFGSPDTRFATIVEFGETLPDEVIQLIECGKATLHDLRAEDRRTVPMNRPTRVVG